MAFSSGSDEDYKPAFMRGFHGEFDKPSADFFHENLNIESPTHVHNVDTPPPPLLDLPITFSDSCPPLFWPNPASFGESSLFQQPFQNMYLPPVMPIPTTVLPPFYIPPPEGSPSPVNWNACVLPIIEEPQEAPPPKKRAKRPKVEPRLNPITGHPMPPTSKARTPRIKRKLKIDDKAPVVQEGKRKKKKKYIPRDAVCERDALSRKLNQCYQKGTVVVKHDEVDAVDYGQSVWVVDGYQLLQKFALDFVNPDGSRAYGKTDRFIGWLADDPALYFPIPDVLYDEDLVTVPSYPSKQEVLDYFDRMEVNRPVFPKTEIDEESFPGDPQPPSTSVGSSSSHEMDYDGSSIKEEEKSEDDLEDGEIID